jgi:hypothetical protein
MFRRGGVKLINRSGHATFLVEKKRRMNPSTELCFALTEEGALVLETREQGLHRARVLLRKYVAEGVTLSDELIAERRAEAAHETR